MVINNVYKLVLSALIATVVGACANKTHDDCMDIPIAYRKQGVPAIRIRLNDLDVAMLVDTGAARTAVGASIASALDLRPNDEIVLSTPQGSAKFKTARIDRVRVGAIEIRQLNAAISPALSAEGLLGMDVLRKYQIEIGRRYVRLQPYPVTPEY